jgi:hypothetical protein
MRSLAFLVLILVFSGCICCDVNSGNIADYISSLSGGYEAPGDGPGAETVPITYPPALGDGPGAETPQLTYSPPEDALHQQTTAYATTTTIARRLETTHTTIAVPLADYDKSALSVMIAGCDDDYYKNAMVAGYVVNTGEKTASNVVLITELQDASGQPVEGGVKEQTIREIAPGYQVPFTQVYLTPPNWSKCRAYIK